MKINAISRPNMMPQTMMLLHTLVLALLILMFWGMISPAFAAGDPIPLDLMFARFVKNITGPMMKTVYTGSYIFGVYVIMKGVFKCIKYSDEGSKGQQKFSGLWGNMLFGAMLIALPGMMVTMANTLGLENIDTVPLLSYADGLSDDIQKKFTRTYWSVLCFVQMLGLISFMRGLNILRLVTDGNNQVTSMAGITHLVAGAMAWNLGDVVLMIGETVGYDLA